MTTTADQIRQWRGPAILSFGFRPMFLLAALWATGAMGLWVAMLAGTLTLPSRFDPVTWHAHEFLFGYLSAVIAGFLLTAVPNWTGRLPVVGWRLAGLALLWVAGRVAVAWSSHLPFWLVVVADVAFLGVLGLVVLREIVVGKNWKNLPVLGIVDVLIIANLLFYLDFARGEAAAQGVGLRLGLAAALVLVAVIGGKIIPSFTRNWLAKHNATQMPTLPMQQFDKATILATITALLGWVFAPTHALTGVALAVIALLHIARLARWQGFAAWSEPLVWVLHAAYAFIPLGAAAMATAIFAPHVLSNAAALHVWTAGALGLMTMAVMTRASLGHSGRALLAGWGTTLIYLALVGSVAARVAADVLPDLRDALLNVAAFGWIVCFAGFVLVYGPMLLRAKPDRS
ncbi:uncharacterized protein involved in response to NO [Pseudorhodobacter antarcticus]|uniref:Uncharacterized protein involved in response to NO n=1 Tax=Pseudorhodobacter antarcticus TaxID=1077947 RepID=A0A1H8HB93_9RHOB|nr:NnrS family protein [Pseudorhodobacter antarcticus]SEN53513.1 uncharacterized protein involved in response to NO [Pseudorhodobacter antarcticus]